MFRKNIYKWHRKLSIIIAFPVLIWAISGILHPIMSSVRPQIATQKPPENIIDTSLLKDPLRLALKENGISEYYNFRIVRFDNQLYYQVKISADSTPLYFSATDGMQLQNGDELYAVYLASHFVSKEKLKVVSVDLVKGFTDEYFSINRYLPVYRVKFKRSDGICIYADTEQSRFSYATNNTRSFLSHAFNLLHTWSWMGNLTFFKAITITLLMLLVFVNAVIGLYIFFTTKQKMVNGNDTLKRRRNHRFTAVFASLFTLSFSFSGGVHMISKLYTDDSGSVISSQKIWQSESILNFDKICQIVKKPIVDISIVKMNGQLFARIKTDGKNKNAGKDLMKEMSVEKPEVIFINTKDYSVLQNGDKLYAEHLAANYTHTNSSPLKTTEITALGNDYDFSDKVLPVWKIEDNHQSVFVETATAKLRKASSGMKELDAFSFSVLHKHEFMMFAGKTAKDFSTIFWAAAQIVLVFFGLILYFKKKKKSSQSK